MQPMYTPPKAGKVAFQQGLIFGLIQAAIASAILLINAFVNNTPAQVGTALLLGVVSFLCGLAAYFVAGMLAAKQTGKVSTGTFAGMWTGTFYGVIGFVVSMVIFFQISLPRLLDTMANSDSATLNLDTFKTGAIIGGVGFAIFGILFAVGLGAGLGALGGLAGRGMSKAQPVPAMPVYPAYPYPVQPMPAPYAPQAYPAQPAPVAYPPQPSPEQFAATQVASTEQAASQPYMEQPQ